MLRLFMAVALTGIIPGIGNAQPVTKATAIVARETILARLYVPGELNKRIGAREFERNYLASFDKGPQSAAVEKQFPGMRASGLRAGLAVMSVAYDREIPQWQSHVAAYFLSNFTAVEIDQLINFYGSTAGLALTHAVAEGMDTSAFVQQATANPGAVKLKPEDGLSMLKPSVLSDLDQAQIADVLRFNASPVGRKLQKQTPALQTILANDVNATTDAIAPELQAKIIEAVSAHIASFRKKGQ